MAANWFKPGQRVLVSESCVAEQFHESCQLPWNVNLHPVWQGKVGVITRVMNQNESASIRFYAWDQPQNQGGGNYNKRLMEVELVFHRRVLRPMEKLHFLDGDRPVLHETVNGKPEAVTHVSLRIHAVEEIETVYSLRAVRTPAFLWRQSRQDQETLVPVYVGKSRQYLLRERMIGNVEISSDASAPRIINGELQGTPGTELINAIKTWSEHGGAKMRMAVQRFPDQINAVLPNGKTALMTAVDCAEWPAVVALISLSANRDAVDPKGNTLLHLAAASGCVKVMEGLIPFLERDVNRVNDDGDTPLHIASRMLHAACVDRLLCAHMIHTNIPNHKGETVLHVVCNAKESESSAVTTILSRLLSSPRINFNAVNDAGLTAPQIAILRGNARSIELILMARPNLLLNSNPNFLNYAAMHGRNKIVDVIIGVKNDVGVDDMTGPDGKTGLHAAVETWQGDVENDLERLACIQSLASAGFSLNAQDENGQTPCHLLVEFMNMHPKEMDRNVLHNAVANHRASMKLDELAAKLKPHWQLAALCFLIARGFDMSLRDKNGDTIVDLCKDEKLKDTLKIFVTDRVRSCLPMTVTKHVFDVTEVHMCTFNCEDSVADVLFVPCGHRVVCKDCAAQTPLRRCPVCYGNITSAKDIDGNPVEMGSAVKMIQAVKEVADQEKAKKSEEEARKTELEELRDRLLKLEMETSCAICLDARPSLVFNCGHTSCGQCAESLELCHICRKKIIQKQVIYT